MNQEPVIINEDEEAAYIQESLQNQGVELSIDLIKMVVSAQFGYLHELGLVD